ncbi:MAG: nucleoside deaminase [Fibrobacteraceae bacterium]
MTPEFLERAIELAKDSVRKGGGPFGAVITKGDKIIAETSNSVTTDLDPSAHAEVNAIRKACKVLGTYDLEGTEIYSSCEPCPMCLGAIYWAHISKLYFAATRNDAKDAGFDDEFIYTELAKSTEERKVLTMHIDHKIAKEPFLLWAQKTDKKEY